MAYEKIGQAEFCLHIFQQIQDLIAHGNIQRGNRLVAYDKLRVQGGGSGDADALALSAGKLVGIAVQMLPRHAHSVHKLQHPGGSLILRGKLPVCLQRLGNYVSDGHAGVKRGVGVLKYELHFAAIGAKLLFG